MAIVRAGTNDLEPCVDILFRSKLGQTYYPRRELLREELERAMRTDEIFVEKTGG